MGGVAHAWLVLAALPGFAGAQMRGQWESPDEHPNITVQECSAGGRCRPKRGRLVVDANWRWMHNVGGFTGCINSTSQWEDAFCPNVTACSQNCAVEGVTLAKYNTSYGITVDEDGYGVTLRYQPHSRIYVLDGDQYMMFKLLNREISFDVDLSTLPCGVNGALYVNEMQADGGGSEAGATYGTGYCDAGCTRGMKFNEGLANLEGWGFETKLSPEGEPVKVGPYGDIGSCCAEFDILEANSQAGTFVSHPCSLNGSKTCRGDDCGRPGFCSGGGCGFNAYEMGNRSFWGKGSNFTLDTSKPFTVITRFITRDGTDDSDMVSVARLYIQNGKVIENAKARVLEYPLFDDMNDLMCKERWDLHVAQTLTWNHNASNTSLLNDHTLHGGLKSMGEALGRGMVLTMSVWDDKVSRLTWLDAEKWNINQDPSMPTVSRGPCDFEDGDPKKIKPENPDAYVKFSNIKTGPIGSTYLIDEYIVLREDTTPGDEDGPVPDAAPGDENGPVEEDAPPADKDAVAVDESDRQSKVPISQQTQSKVPISQQTDVPITDAFEQTPSFGLRAPSHSESAPGALVLLAAAAAIVGTVVFRWTRQTNQPHGALVPARSEGACEACLE